MEKIATFWLFRVEKYLEHVPPPPRFRRSKLWRVMLCFPPVPRLCFRPGVGPQSQPWVSAALDPLRQHDRCRRLRRGHSARRCPAVWSHDALRCPHADRASSTGRARISLFPGVNRIIFQPPALTLKPIGMSRFGFDSHAARSPNSERCNLGGDFVFRQVRAQATELPRGGDVAQSAREGLLEPCGRVSSRLAPRMLAERPSV